MEILVIISNPKTHAYVIRGLTYTLYLIMLARVYFLYSVFLWGFMDNLEFKNLRIKLGLTQLSLASALDLSSNTIARIERGYWPVSKVISLSMLYLEILHSNADKSAPPAPLESAKPKPLPVITKSDESPACSFGRLSLSERQSIDTDLSKRLSKKRELALKRQAQYDAIKKP